MTKSKLILISILALFATITIVLFAIERIDYALHYNTYSKIDKFFVDVATIRNKDKCYTNYASIFTNRKKSFEKNKVPFSIVISPDVYDKTFSSCTQFKNDLAAINVPNDISAESQVLLKKYQTLTKSTVDYLLVDLNRFYKCKGNPACLNNTKQILDKKRFSNQKVIYEVHIAAAEVQKRFSYKYFFILRPMENKYKHKLQVAKTGNNLPHGQRTAF